MQKSRHEERGFIVLLRHKYVIQVLMTREVRQGKNFSSQCLGMLNGRVCRACARQERILPTRSRFWLCMVQSYESTSTKEPKSASHLEGGYASHVRPHLEADMMDRAEDWELSTTLLFREELAIHASPQLMSMNPLHIFPSLKSSTFRRENATCGVRWINVVSPQIFISC